MPFLTINGTTFHYLDQGCETGPPLVFLHGFTLDHRQWEGETAFFGENFRVVIPDSRGHGLSDAPETNYSRADRVADLVGLLDVLHLDEVHLVGLSMGGSTAVGLALAHPDRLRSLTLISTGIAGYNFGKKISRLDQLARDEGPSAALKKWKEMSLLYFKDSTSPIRHLMAQMMDDHTGAIWMDPMRGKYPREVDLDRVADIATPTLIIAGELDKVFARLSTELHALIPGSELRIYPGVGHMVNLEAPDMFHTDLDRFLAARR